MHTGIRVLNDAAGAWASWMLHMSWQVAVLAALVWMISRETRLSSARFRNLLWLLVFVKLVVPPMLATPWSAGNLLTNMPSIRLTSARATFQGGAERAFPPAEDVKARAGEGVHHAASPTASQPTAIPATAATNSTEILVGRGDSVVSGIRISAWVMLGWAGMSLMLMLVIAIQFQRYVRAILRGASLGPLELQDIVGAHAASYGLRRDALIMVSGAVYTPAVFGVRRPIILLPANWQTISTGAELSDILGHEVAHVKRGDLFISGLTAALTCLYWFHPAVWLANLYQRREREMACDDLVLESKRAEGKTYASTLLRVAEHSKGRTPAFAGFLGLLELSDNLLHRVVSATDEKRPRRLGWRSVVALGAVVLVMPMGIWTASADDEQGDANDRAVTNEDAVDKEIEAHYSKADPEVQEYIRWTARTFGRSGLWKAENAFDDLTPEQREEKIVYFVGVLDGEYGRHLCDALASAGALKDKRLLPGVMKAALYHRDDSDYECRPKWIAVEAAGRFDDDSIVPQLVPLVDHGNQNTRMWARASLSRLTGQNFRDDKQAWGKWWNDGDKEPKIDLSQLKPWAPPGDSQTPEQAAQSSPQSPRDSLPATVPAESLAVVEKLPGELVFKGTYAHRSRGADLPQPSTVWIKTTGGEEQVIAAAYLPAFNETTVAYLAAGRNPHLHRYESYYHGRDERPPSSRFLDFTQDAATVTYRGGEKDGQTETLSVPSGAVFWPNSRPDSYCAEMGMLFPDAPMSAGYSAEGTLYDWDNTGKGMASYNARIENVGKEEIALPAGTFRANHYVETQLTFGDTWFKKRPGHVTDYWVLDNGVVVRILRHREPYELQLLSVETPAELPGGTLRNPPSSSTQQGQALPIGTVRGVVLNDATNEPVRGAFVAIDHSGDAGGANLERFEREGLYITAETDAKGRFTLEKAALREDHPFYVTAQGFVRHQQTVALTAQNAEKEFEVRLKPGATIRVGMQSGSRESGVDIMFRLSATDGRLFYPPKADWPAWPYRMEHMTGDAYEFGELGPGTYRVEALAIRPQVIEYLGRIELDLAPGESKSVEIEPRPNDTQATLTADRDPYTDAGPFLVAGPGFAVPLTAGEYVHPEAAALGEIIAHAAFSEFRANRPGHLDTKKPIELKGFPPGKYTAFVVGFGDRYPNTKSGAAYPRWAAFELREHERTTAHIPWVEPKGPQLGAQGSVQSSP